MSKPKVAFLIPAYGSVSLPSWQSHINLIANAGRFCSPAFLTASSCYVTESRNRLIEIFVEADSKIKFDYVFWIDSDIVFSYSDCEALIDLMKKNKEDIGSGLYFNPLKDGLTPMAQLYDKDEDKYVAVDNVKTIMRVDGVGFGFVCMKADVVRNLLREHDRLFEMRYSKRDKLVGEDNFFCELARGMGYKVFLFPSVRVGHAKVLPV